MCKMYIVWATLKNPSRNQLIRVFSCNYKRRLFHPSFVGNWAQAKCEYVSFGCRGILKCEKCKCALLRNGHVPSVFFSASLFQYIIKKWYKCNYKASSLKMLFKENLKQPKLKTQQKRKKNRNKQQLRRFIFIEIVYWMTYGTDTDIWHQKMFLSSLF